MPMKLVRKNDHTIEIVATLETIQGTCGIIDPKVDDQGNLVFDYDGSGTKVDWDSQETVRRFIEGVGTSRVFIDENDDEVLEKDIELIEVEPCEECRAEIEQNGASMISTAHDQSCSLHPDNIVN